MSDADLFRRFTIECLEAGVDTVSYLVGGAGQHGYDDIISPPAGRRLSTEDVLIFDTGCTVDGYFCNLERYYCFGELAAMVKKAHHSVWQPTQA